MRIHPRTWLTALALTAGTMVPAGASAQVDIDPPRPNVLLLIDTSGSMEYLPDGTLPTVCDPSNTSSQVNRWTALVQSLTGTVNGRRCFVQRRNPGSQPPSAVDFVDEFKIGGVDPYDKGYKLPYHRIVSGAELAVVTPGTAPLDIYDWPADAVQFRKLASSTKQTASLAGWSQQANGLIDVFGDRIRFGLMTFDPVPEDPVSTAMPGMWSYFPGWISSTAAAARGNPVDCTSGYLKPFDVGCRNPAAPPWEGRLIGFGPTNRLPLTCTSAAQCCTSPLTCQRDNNERIQQALLAVRPYGATPLAGMMADAYTFFQLDTAEDPTITLTGGGHPRFGTKDDPYYSGGCRESYMIVLSDGEPNLDLRPSCGDKHEPPAASPSGNCPYDEPWEYAERLASITQTGQAVKTYAVGFGMSKDKANNPPLWDCTTIDENNWSTKCSAANQAAYAPLKACCTLAQIAIAGETGKAYFPDTPEELTSSLSQVLAAIASKSTSRTLPAFSSGTAVGSVAAPAVAYEFVSSFQTLTEDNIWSGNLERKRWVCEEVNGVLQPVLEDVTPSLGDDFTANLHATAPNRKFFTVLGTEESNQIHSTRTIRKTNTIGDDLTDYVGTATSLLDRGSFAAAVGAAPLAMGITQTVPSYCALLGSPTPDDDTCAERLVRWHVGETNAGLAPSREDHQFGAIYHSSPVVFGAPSDFLRDESYSTFADTTGNAQRPLMLYTATTDGQLHAFQVATNKPGESNPLGDGLENNELWAFIPPYVLPSIYGLYPNTQQILLDGAPVVRDVVFERDAGDAQAASSQWRTVLLAGGGGAGGFYYALDVTNPAVPTFLWQLSTDDAGNPLFGARSATPAIATISYPDDSTNPPTIKEVAVAILPGGGPGTPTTGCDAVGLASDTRQIQDYDHINPGTSGKPKPRPAVRCWASGPGRSLTIVRLDNGEIIKTFRGKADDGPHGVGTTLDSDRVKVVGFDSPITGVPVPYPARPGQVADRIYVGDEDGTLWRISVAMPDPDDWRADIAFDAYSANISDGNPASADTYNSGQPVAIPPVVGVDGMGNTIILFATGDQEDFTTYDAGMRTRVWSLKESPKKVDDVPFTMESNWVIRFTGGKRVTGPIALFDTAAYFATFQPQQNPTNACIDGYGSIWGVDYLKAESASSPPYPVARLEQKVGNTITYLHEEQQAAGVVVFGVMVSAQPSCFDTDDDVADTYLGKHTAITTTTPPVYQLVYQTGSGGAASGGAKTKTNTRQLPPLRELTRIDSWASIVE